MTKYLVGDPANGPFASFHASDDEAAREEAEKQYGHVADEVDWTDNNGDPIVLIIVTDAR